MKNTLNSIGVYAILTLGILGLVLTGCTKGPPPTAEQVQAQWLEKTNQIITDPVRAAQVNAVIRQMLEAQQVKAAALAAASDRLALMNADYTASKQDLLAVYHDYEAKQKDTVLTFRDGILEIRKLVSEKEWKKLTK